VRSLVEYRRRRAGIGARRDIGPTASPWRRQLQQPGSRPERDIPLRPHCAARPAGPLGLLPFGAGAARWREQERATVSSQAGAGGSSAKADCHRSASRGNECVPAGQLFVDKRRTHCQQGLHDLRHIAATRYPLSAGAFRVFYVGPGSIVTISGVTIRDGHPARRRDSQGGGLLEERSESPTLRCSVTKQPCRRRRHSAGNGGGSQKAGGIASRPRRPDHLKHAGVGQLRSAVGADGGGSGGTRRRRP